MGITETTGGKHNMAYDAEKKRLCYAGRQSYCRSSQKKMASRHGERVARGRQPPDATAN